MKIAMISEADVLRHATRTMAFDAVRTALVAAATGESSLFPVSIGAGAPAESMVAIKSGFLAGPDAVGVKVGTYWPDNAKLGVPNHGSTTLLLDPQTGLPRALVNAGALNGLRTAAANAVATEALARADAKTLLIVGPGHQARCEVRALCDVRSFDQVLVWGRSQEKATSFANAMASEGLPCEVAESLESAVRKADVITTATTATAPLFPSDWVQPGTHISAMGADKAGKQELAPELLRRARLFADNPAQSREIGEFQHAGDSAVTAIGDVLRGVAQGRESASEVTVFDSSGIALQDIAIAGAVWDALREAGELAWVDF